MQIFCVVLCKYKGDNTTSFARFGGNSSSDFVAGCFYLELNNVVSYSNWNYGVALTYYLLRVINQGFARFGSNPNDGLLVGAFALNLNNAVSNSNWNYGVALSY